MVRGSKPHKTARMRDQTHGVRAQVLFAANMRRIRRAKKLTQEDVANLAELHTNYISSVERGERNISLRNIVRVALALGVSVSELVDGVEDPAD